MIASFYEEATREQQQLLSVAENRLREILAASPATAWQVLVDLLGPDAVLAWAKDLAEEEKAALDGEVARAQERVDAVSVVLTTAVVAEAVEI